MSTAQKKKSNEIIVVLQKGEHRHAFDLLYKSCWPKVLNYIRKNNGDKAEAEDIFHDALIVFFKQVKLGKYDSGQEAGGYVYSVARNLWINYVKKRNRQVAIEARNPESDEDIHQSFVAKEWEDQVIKLMSVLGERCKELLTWTIFHNLKLIEVMEKMNFGSIDVVKTKHYKCKQRLIKAVKENLSIQSYLRND